MQHHAFPRDAKNHPPGLSVSQVAPYLPHGLVAEGGFIEERRELLGTVDQFSLCQKWHILARTCCIAGALIYAGEIVGNLERGRSPPDAFMRCRHEGDLIIVGTCRYRGVRSLNRPPLFLSAERDLGPLEAQFTADWQDDVACQEMRELQSPALQTCFETQGRYNSGDTQAMTYRRVC